jgi:hypothetical protein
MPYAHGSSEVTCGSLAVAWQLVVLNSICFGLDHVLPPLPSASMDLDNLETGPILHSLGQLLTVMSKHDFEVNFPRSSAQPLQRMQGFEEIDDLHFAEVALPFVLQAVSIQTKLIQTYCNKGTVNSLHPHFLFSVELVSLLGLFGYFTGQYSEFLYKNQLTKPEECRTFYRFTKLCMDVCTTLSHDAQNRRQLIGEAILEFDDRVDVLMPFLALTSAFMEHVSGTLIVAKVQDMKLRCFHVLLQKIQKHFETKGSVDLMEFFQDLFHWAGKVFDATSLLVDQNSNS